MKVVVSRFHASNGSSSVPLPRREPAEVESEAMKRLAEIVVAGLREYREQEARRGD